MKMDTDDFAEWAASKQVEDEHSVRSFWKDLIQLRKENKLFVSASCYQRQEHS